jgi:hypothetical protein
VQPEERAIRVITPTSAAAARRRLSPEEAAVAALA